MDDHDSMDVKCEEEPRDKTYYLGLLPICVLLIILIARVSFVFCKSYGQKTRTPAQRRMYVGSRARPSLSQTEPTIYVSPTNLPPPPKYELLAPPSYEEVVGVHYPQYQSQPITQPIEVAMAEASAGISIHGTGNAASAVSVSVRDSPGATVNVTSEANSQR